MQLTGNEFSAEAEYLDSVPVTKVCGNNSKVTKSTYQLAKRLLEPFIAFVILLFLSPLFGLIALAIKLDSSGAVFHRRLQVRENDDTFKAYKFRTMYENNDDQEYKNYLVKYIQDNAPYTVDQNGKSIFKVVSDQRVTRIGSFLRKTNLDELPQFINVLKGEMSLVGPRPDIPFAVAMYKNWHRNRLVVKPGITGLWQVCNRKSLSFEDMVRLDIDYIKRQSLLLDIRIIILTVVTILKRDGSQ